MNVEQLSRVLQVSKGGQKVREKSEQGADFQDIVSQILSMMNMPLGEQSAQGQLSTDSEPQLTIGLSPGQPYNQDLAGIVNTNNEAELPLNSHGMENGSGIAFQAEMAVNNEQLLVEESVRGFHLAEVIKGQEAHGADLEHGKDLAHGTDLIDLNHFEKARTYPQAKATQPNHIGDKEATHSWASSELVTNAQAKHSPSMDISSTVEKTDIPIMLEVD